MHTQTPNIKELFTAGVNEAENVLKTFHDIEPDESDKQWRAPIFSQYPRRFAHKLAREYEEKYIFESRRAANLYLLDQKDRNEVRQIPLTSNEHDLEQLAKKHSSEMRQLAMIMPDDEQAVIKLWPLSKSYGIKPPNLYDPNITPMGILNRLWDEDWWLRQLRRAHAINLEEEAISLGFVHQRAGVYISDESLLRYKEQKIRNRRILSRMIAINEDNQIFKLEDLIAKGTSNPINRRNELMCRVFGFENIANELGHAADFLTLTCPSRMHARLSKSGNANPKYDGTTPKQAQKYLTTIWSRIRAKGKRDGIEMYGFRVAEPHQDGTPHWHLLVFTDPNNLKAIRDTFSHYALEEDGHEVGALEHRFTFKPIDKTKGSAIGYIAKYISKNIDGYAIDKDELGVDAKDSAERVTAWASTWGIRQFQQFGGAPVTIWRELRKAKACIPEGILSKAFTAADSGNWAEFLKLLGGATPLRKELPIQLNKIEPEELGKYGDPVGKQITGLIADNITLTTRLHEWSIISVKRLTQMLKSVPIFNTEADELICGDAYARASAVGIDTSGEAALEYCQ